MPTDQYYINELHKQLNQGNIQKGYKILLDYILSLKNHFQDKYPEYSIPNSIYHGYLDMTYFPIFPNRLKAVGLKIAVVFNYIEFRFEVWLSANNKKVQKEYWKIIKAMKWDKYKIVDTVQGYDSIIEKYIDKEIDLDNQRTLTEAIEKEVIGFIKDIEENLKI